MRDDLSNVPETPISPEHEKELIRIECEKRARPLVLDAEMLRAEAEGLQALADQMRDFMAEAVKRDETLMPIWKDRIARIEAQAAVATLLSTDKATKANRFVEHRDELIAAVELEASITPGVGKAGNIH